jgi:hypothetical protein
VPASASGSSLHRRLTITYTAALAAGLLIFSILSLATIDRTLENTLDARLATTARAFAMTAAGRVGAARGRVAMQSAVVPAATP